MMYGTFKRHATIALEHLADGLTFPQLAVKHGLSQGRVHQIYVKLLEEIGCTRNATAQSVGLAIQRRHKPRTINTPAWFHQVLNNEREEDTRVRYYRDLD